MFRTLSKFDFFAARPYAARCLTPRGSARAARGSGFAALVAVALLFATNNAAFATVVVGTQADLSWAAAPGSVVEYGIWVVPEGGAPSSAPTLRIGATSASIPGQYGEAVQVFVAAYYTGDVLGPYSAPSQTIYFRAPAPAPFDLNGDGRVDRTLRDVLTGDIHVQLVDGLATLAEAELLAPNPRHLHVSGSADFDGDGNADIVMAEKRTGTAELWLFDGEVVRAKLPIAALGANWMARSLGDINADGTARLFWHKADTGETQLWSMRDAQVVAQQTLLDMPSNWELSANCDVDGNGFRDLVWADQKAGTARLWMLDAAGSVNEVELPHPGVKWWIQTCGDFDRDGSESIVWQRRKGLRIWSFDQLDPATSAAVGTTRTRPVPRRHWANQAADLDADGDADLVFLNYRSDAITTQLLEAGAVSGEQQTALTLPARWMLSSW